MSDLEKRKKQRISILGCPIDNVSLNEAIGIIEEFITSKTINKCIAINADKIIKFKKDPVFKKFLLSGDLNITDGQSIVWTGKLFGVKIKERFGGLDIIEKLIPIASYKGYSVYFLGGHNNVINELVKFFKNKFAELNIVGFRNGYWSLSEEWEVVQDIKSKSPDILFIAISSPKREIFIEKYKNEINASFVMGVGGAFDVLVGEKKRAPQWVQKIGFEWLFRLLQEPRRLWKRYLIGNTYFVLLVLLEFLKFVFKNNKKDVY